MHNHKRMQRQHTKTGHIHRMVGRSNYQNQTTQIRWVLWSFRIIRIQQKTKHEPITTQGSTVLATSTTNSTITPTIFTQPHYRKTRQTTLSNFPTDNEFMGDVITTKQSSNLRIYYTNVNGINPNRNDERLNLILDNMNNISTDIIGFAEHNLDVSQSKLRYDLQSIVKKHIPSSQTIASTSPLKFPSAFKPGGCMTIITRNLHSLITEQRTG